MRGVGFALEPEGLNSSIRKSESNCLHSGVGFVAASERRAFASCAAAPSFRPGRDQSPLRIDEFDLAGGAVRSQILMIDVGETLKRRAKGLFACRPICRLSLIHI